MKKNRVVIIIIAVLLLAILGGGFYYNKRTNLKRDKLIEMVNIWNINYAVTAGCSIHEDELVSYEDINEFELQMELYAYYHDTGNELTLNDINNCLGNSESNTVFDDYVDWYTHNGEKITGEYNYSLINKAMDWFEEDNSSIKIYSYIDNI